MSNIIILSFVLVFALISPTICTESVFHRTVTQNKTPDFSKAEDLQALGTGRIIEKDNSVLKNIKLIEVKEYWIVFEKNSSTHDLMMDVISRIEFPESKWGAIKLEFLNNKPEAHSLYY